MRSLIVVLCLAPSFACGDTPREANPEVHAGFADSPWNISIQGTVRLPANEQLTQAQHRIEVWLESPGCGIHSVTLLVQADGTWNCDLATERAECAYGGTLTVQNAWINGRALQAEPKIYEWRMLAPPLELVFREP